MADLAVQTEGLSTSQTYFCSTRSVHQTPLSDRPNGIPSAAMARASIFSTTGACRQRRADCQALDASDYMWTVWWDILEIYPLSWMARHACSVVPWYSQAGGAAGVSSGSTQGME